MSKSATVQEFAKELNICKRHAYGMARNELFQKHKIVFDIGTKHPGKRQYHSWRFDIQRYYEARAEGLI